MRDRMILHLHPRMVITTYETVLLAPYRYSKGGTVSMMTLELVRLSCVNLTAYPLEFDAKMSM